MLSTLKTTDVRSRIEPEIKDRATAVLASCGLNLSDAIRLFLRQEQLVIGFVVSCAWFSCAYCSPHGFTGREGCCVPIGRARPIRPRFQRCRR